MELEESQTPFEPVDDKRPRIENPLPVRLVAVADCLLTAWAGLEDKLDEFYVKLLGFERQDSVGIVYRADNFMLRFEVVERPPVREDYLALGITVPLLEDLVKKLTDLEIPFSRQQKLTLGAETLLVYDPAGNLIEIGQTRTIL